MLPVILSALLLVLFVDRADAFFVVGAVVSAAGITGFAATVVSAVGSLALAFGLSYVAGQLLAKDVPGAATRTVGGSKLDLRVDVDVPRSIPFGWVVTAGSLVYANTFGSRGDIDNSDLIEIIALADCPCEGIADYVFVEGTKQTYQTVGQEFIVDNYQGENGNDKLTFRFYDGTQTAADALAVLNLGTAARPWTAAMVGQGVAYVRVHAAYEPTKITGPLQWKFVIKGIKLYDPRKDTTVGGSGAHRYTTLSTHEWTDNPMVMAYNILRGIYVADDGGTRRHLYGLKRTAASDLPLSEWFAAMNACDEAMSGTNDNPRYRAGGEITVDTEPREAALELLKCCGGRFTELGGVFKPYIDTPELPVISFTDDDILDQEDTFKPVLPLEQRVNYITGKYTSPVNWDDKVAPPFGDDDFETEDGRRLPASLDAPMVQYGPQMQRLMRQYLKRARRGRKHQLSLPPWAFRVEAGQVVLWNSTRNGYVDKLFEVDGVDYHTNLCVTLALTEVDPSDYDWEDGFELPESDGPLPSNIPEPKVIAGFSAAPITVEGDDGTKKPGIELTWDDPDDDDSYRVVFQVRRAAQPLNVQTGENNEPQSGKVVIVGGLAPDTDYEVRGKFDSRSGYRATWSLWIPVTTPDARLSDRDFVAGLRAEIREGIEERTQQIRESQELLAALIAEMQSSTALDKTELVTKVEKTRDNLRIAYINAITEAIGPDSAVAQAIESLEVQIGEVSAGGKAQFVVGVIPAGAIASYDLQLTAEGAKAGMQLIAKNIGGVRTGQIRFDASNILFGKSGSDASFKTIFVVDTSTTPPRVLIDGNLLAAGSIEAASLAVGRLSAIAADLGTVTAGRMLFESAEGRLDMTANPPRILLSEAL